MADRHASGDPPFTLLLGAGASRSSGYPDAKAFVRDVLTDLGRPRAPNAPLKTLRHAFETEWQAIGIIDHYRLLRKHFPPIPPSPGYHFLGQLVKAGYIRRILTTNVDALTEESLIKSGVSLPCANILTIGALSPHKAKSAMIHLDRDHQIHVVKLHGDIPSRHFCFTTEEMDTALGSDLEQYLYDSFQNGILVVGHALDDPDLRRCFLPSASSVLDAPCFFVQPSRLPMFARKNRTRLLRISSITSTSKDRLGQFDVFFEELHKCLFPSQHKPTAANVIFADSLSDGDLAGFQALWGSYSLTNHSLAMGRPGQEVHNLATVTIPHIITRDVKIEARFTISDDGGDSTNWFGFMMRAQAPHWPEGCFVYFRSRGDMDIMRLDGSKITIGDPNNSILGLEAHVTVTLRGRNLEVSTNYGIRYSDRIEELPDSFGRVFIHSYRTKTFLHQLTLRSPIESRD